MAVKIYIFSICLFLICAGQTAYSQCLTEAGTLSGTDQSLCAGQALDVSGAGNAVLDGDDILVFVAYTGATPQTGTVLATSVSGSFGYQAGFLANSPFSVAAVAGNDVGGQVDWTDTCLSVSPPLTVTYSAGPDLVVSPPVFLNCFVLQTILPISGNVPPGSTYQWTGPGGFASNQASPTVSAPGTYCLTVTDPAGCTDAACIQVLANTNPPIVNAGPGQVLTCVINSIVLDATGSSTGPNIVYEWSASGGGNIVAGQNTLTPVVNEPGNYILVVSNTTNGCTSSTTVIVTQDIAPPSADAGPAQVLTCAQTVVELAGTGSQGSQFFFQWSGPVIISGGNSPNALVGAPGQYTLTITNIQNGCTATDVVDVVQDATLPSVIAFGSSALDCDHPTVQLDGTGTSQGPNFTYVWTGPGILPITQNLLNPVVSIPGEYTLTVVNTLNGCTSQFTLIIDGVPLTDLTVTDVLCSGQSTGAIEVAGFDGGQAPFTLDWQGPGGQSFSGPQLTNLNAGGYYLTITDQTGCMLHYLLAVTEPDPLVVTSSFSSLCDSTIVTVQVTGGTQPYTYSWPGTLGSGPVVVFTVADLYTLTITDANGCSALFEIPVDVFTLCGFISGQVVEDVLENCSTDAGEPGLAGWIVKATTPGGAAFYGVTDSSGYYFIQAALGDYTVSAVPPAPGWMPCPGPVPVSVTAQNDTFPAADLLMQTIVVCPALTVSIGTALLRRCFDTNYYHITWCNQGTASATDAYVLVTLDPFLTPVSATLPFLDLGNGILRFDVGQVDVGECSGISLWVEVSCDAVIGQTHCTEAHIYPDTACLPNHPLWSGASVEVHAVCDGDSLRFIIKNVGTADMTQMLEYIVIEDHVMLMPIPHAPLAAGDSVIITLPANGDTWRIEANQEPFHPGLSQPILSIEGCTNGSGNFTTGLVNNFPLNDADPWIDIDCTENGGSYDPNDKQGFPEGYGTEHFIEPGTELAYRIRFQNTGTDTAFTVVIRDTLAAWLDPASLRPGPASHPYTFGLSGPGYLTYTFDNILLPDSNINEPASHGFVQFTVRPRSNAPLETLIENQASIYFDFNDPVPTNTTFHRLGENFVTLVYQPSRPDITISAFPNPFREVTRLEVRGLTSSEPLHLRVFDRFGIMVYEATTSGTVFLLRPDGWPAGVYFFSLQQGGAQIGSGKLIVRD